MSATSASALSRPLSASTANTANTSHSLSGSKERRTMTPSPDRNGGGSALPPPAAATAARSGLARRFNYRALHTSPSFFSINMGTGIASILLHNFPYHARWLRILGDIVFVLNVVIFVVLLFLTAYRYLKFKGSFRITLDHVTASMFWGCFPMGFVTIVVSPGAGECGERGREAALTPRTWSRSCACPRGGGTGRGWRWACGGSTLRLPSL